MTREQLMIRKYLRFVKEYNLNENIYITLDNKKDLKDMKEILEKFKIKTKELKEDEKGIYKLVTLLTREEIRGVNKC